MKKGYWLTLCLALGSLGLHKSSLAAGYFNIGLNFGGGYGNYYPSSGYPVGGYGYGTIGGVCGGGCRSSAPYSYPSAYYGGSCGGNCGSQFVGYVSGSQLNGGYSNSSFGSPFGMASNPSLNLGGLGGMGGLPNLGMPVMGGGAATLLPPPQPAIPPHMMANNAPGWGAGFASYPSPGMAPIPGSLLCNAGYLQQPVYPVPGGPVMQSCSNPWGGCYASGSASGLSRGIAGGTTIIDMRSKNAWEMDDAGEIVFNAGLGMSSMLSNVYPIAIDRGMPSLLSPGWFNFGERDINFIPRPTH